MIKKILLADSGTGHSEEMLQMLMEIPSIRQAQVTVLHVVPPVSSADVMTEKLAEGTEFLTRAIQKLKLEPDKISPMLRQGDPKDTVCKVAEEVDADLIIMGSRGLKRIQSILENSVSQYVFQLSSRPMLLVKDDIYVKRINRVMVSLDKSDAAKQCLELGLFLTREVAGSQLFLVHVNPDKEPQNPEEDPVLAAAATEAKKVGVKYRCLTGKGKEGPTICSLAEELNADLLILGSPDRRPSIAKALPDLDRLLGNSLSDYVRVYANCPVLLARISS